MTERVEKIFGRGNGGSLLIHIGTNNAEEDGKTAIVQEPTEEDEASKGWTDHLIRKFTSV